MTTRKSAVNYKAIFKYIERTFTLSPAEIISDFEAGLRKAINEIYPSAKLFGCWFHYCQAIRKKCSELGLGSLLFSNPEARFFQKQILNLPLLPSADINTAFWNISRSIRTKSFADNFSDFLDYFKNYWLKQVLFKFNIKLILYFSSLNTFRMTINFQNEINSISVAEASMRTTSSVESMNAQMGRYFPKHGNIWQFIEQLKFYENMKARDMLKIAKLNVEERTQSQKTKKARDRDSKIKTLSEQLKNRDISAIEFLEMMAENRLLPRDSKNF